MISLPYSFGNKPVPAMGGPACPALIAIHLAFPTICLWVERRTAFFEVLWVKEGWKRANLKRITGPGRKT